MDKKLETIIGVLQQQRNNALDQIANLVGELNSLQEKVKELESAKADADRPA
jgi:flagellar hook-associated protein FlgK